MGFLFGGNSAAAQVPKLSAIQIQTMGYGAPIQVCYGTNRVSPTLGYTADFTATWHQQSGGKGGDGGGGGYYTYSSTIVLMIGEGDIQSYGKVWKDKDIYDDLTKAGLSFSTLGTYPQATWGTMDTKHATESLAYNGTAYVGSFGYALSTGATLGNHSIEVRGHALSTLSTDVNYTDCYIKDVITDFLTNPHYGAISATTASLPLDLTRLHAYTQADGLLISPILTSQKPAHEYLSEWATVANCAMVWSEGKLKFIPYVDETVTGTSSVYNPDTTLRYGFTDDNLSGSM